MNSSSSNDTKIIFKITHRQCDKMPYVATSFTSQSWDDIYAYCRTHGIVLKLDAAQNTLGRWMYDDTGTHQIIINLKIKKQKIQTNKQVRAVRTVYYSYLVEFQFGYQIPEAMQSFVYKFDTWDDVCEDVFQYGIDLTDADENASIFGKWYNRLTCLGRVRILQIVDKVVYKPTSAPTPELTPKTESEHESKTTSDLVQNQSQSLLLDERETSINYLELAVNRKLRTINKREIVLDARERMLDRRERELDDREYELDKLDNIDVYDSEEEGSPMDDVNVSEYLVLPSASSTSC